jgi:hypothetical protein
VSEKSIDLIINVIFFAGILFFAGAPMVLIPRWLNKKESKSEGGKPGA